VSLHPGSAPADRLENSMTPPGPLQPANLFHTGIVVADLAAAKEELGERLGLTWFEGGAEVVLLTDDGAQVVRSAYAMSKEGPHHVELAQAVPGTVWTVAAPGHAHHLGYWVDSVNKASAALTAAGAARVATVAMAEGAPPMCAYHSTGNGLIVEVVSRSLRPVLLPSEAP
jgi:catechol 2,3-dioxygenase-like lactoylglutathione lyase family enzyme